ncbi:hypothetical protein [Nonlabens ulvanivorans]|uniref:hypothetical protein n=1 Tax=Nonlabens ulvanivorans TaxID=906888 RepID=UPI002943F6D6|nr:hypothetical protein [Nonlabens ulvanivorans]WOI23248.1 hypothetical protein R1T42_02120 [Nonlabens ulvanivorans]
MKKFLLFLSLIVLCSCKKEVKTAITEEPTFDYKAYLLRNDDDDDVPTIKMENLEYDQAFPIVKKAYQNMNLPIYDFNTQVFEFTIASELWDYKHDKIPLVRLRTTQIIINSKNEILYDSSLYSIEELNELLYKDFKTNLEETKGNRISIVHDKKANQELIALILNKVEKAYLQTLEEFSFRKHNKPLSRLRIDELKAIKNEYHLALYFPRF